MENKQKLKRPIQKILRFSPEENNYIQQKLEESPYKNFQNFARILLLTGELRVVDYSELRMLNEQVNRIGNNINQIAKLAHQFEEIAYEDIQELLEEISELKNLVANKLLEEIRKE